MNSTLTLKQAFLRLLTVFGVAGGISIFGLIYFVQGIRLAQSDKEQYRQFADIQRSAILFMHELELNNWVISPELRSLVKEENGLSAKIEAKIRLARKTVKESVALEDAIYEALGVGALAQIGAAEEAAAVRAGEVVQDWLSGELQGESFAAEMRSALDQMEEASNRYSIWIEEASSLTINFLLVFISALQLGFGGLLIFTGSRLSQVLKSLSKELDQSSDAVYQAAYRIDEESQKVAQGATEQAAAIEETSASLTEMSSMVNQNSTHSRQARKISENAVQLMQKVNSHMSQLELSMQGIAQSSQETQKIIKTIDEIAFQTNILALNAAVEAARAGEAGAGFAVVADEVRSLAQRSAEAARNTSTMIQESVQKINDGVHLVESTTQSFKEVLEGSVKTGQLVHEITTGSEEQNTGIQEITRAVQELEAVTHTSVAASESTASASGELKTYAERMAQNVAYLNKMAGHQHQSNASH